MSVRSLDWEIVPDQRVVRFTLTQDIVLTPIVFNLPFDFVKFVGAKATVIDTERAQASLGRLITT